MLLTRPLIHTLPGLLALFAGLAILSAPLAAAEVETERMTWTEIRDALAQGKTTIIVPTGGTEQNGPHMVTGKHNFVVRETARRIAEKLGNALVAPVLAYVPEGDIAKREGHMAYPGTISLTPDTFSRVLEDAAHSFAIHGFKLIVFLGDSGPNQEPQRAAAASLSARWAADGVRVITADNYYAANGQVEALKAEGETDATIGSHASIRDTSELMAVYPGGVRADRRAADKDGVTGDPTRASSERGEKLLALKVAAAVNDIEAAKAAPIVVPQPPSLLQRLLNWLFG
ncbi:MAG: creatininase family protein [Hyphomicrobium sp.]|nr:creatininase family protein [Hyphomicrobium sp.]